MEKTSSTEFVFLTGEDAKLIRMHCRMQDSILRTMYDDGNRFYDVKLFGLPPSNTSVTTLQPILGHKSVLAGASKHLLDLFASDGYTDSRQPEHVIEKVDHESLGRVVEFIYTGQVTMATESAVEVMCGVFIGADYLLMNNLADACETFLAEQVNLENCVELWSFGRLYTCLKLMHATSTAIANNLANLSSDVEFLRMPYGDFSKLLMSEAFVTANADQRCLAAIAWVKTESVDRASHVNDILNMIPLILGSVSIDTVHAAIKCGTLWEHAPATMRKLSESVTEKLISTPTVGGGSGTGSSTNGWFVMGGADAPNSFLHYDADLRVWSVLPELPWRRHHFGACAIGSRLLAVGGSTDTERKLSVIDEYDWFSKTWSTSPAKLSTGLSHCQVHTDGQQAYVMGGMLWSWEAFEKYDWKSRQITQLATPSGVFLDISASTISVDTKCLYVAGNQGRIDKVELEYDEWETVGRIITEDWKGMAAIVSGDELYLMGGVVNGRANKTNKVEVFNIRTGHLRTEQNRLRARSSCRATTLYNENVVCVVGGMGEGSGNESAPRWPSLVPLSGVEVFDKREGKWSTGTNVPDMPVPSFHFALAAV